MVHTTSKATVQDLLHKVEDLAKSAFMQGNSKEVLSIARALASEESKTLTMVQRSYNPKTMRSHSTINSDEIVVHRGPGRPRKQIEASAVNANASDNMVVHRGPGRPRKLIEAQISLDRTTTHRGPGRPRKLIEEVLAPLSAISVKRGPGRPRKDQLQPAMAA